METGTPFSRWTRAARPRSVMEPQGVSSLWPEATVPVQRAALNVAVGFIQSRAARPPNLVPVNNDLATMTRYSVGLSAPLRAGVWRVLLFGRPTVTPPRGNPGLHFANALQEVGMELLSFPIQ